MVKREGLSDKQKLIKAERKIKLLQAKLKKERKRTTKYRAKTLTFEALQYRKGGMTWVRIGKKLKVPESSIRLETQARYKEGWLRGRWSESKLSASEAMDTRVRKLLAGEGYDPLTGKKREVLPYTYGEYVREHRS